MLWVPSSLDEYKWSFSSTGATRLTSAWGTSVTPGNNTYGTYAQVLTGAQVARDVFGLWVNINSNGVSAAARDTIVKIGFDPAGNASYTDLITGLLCSSAAGALTAAGGGYNYFFPIWIKAGSSVAVAASVNNVTVGTLRARMRVAGSPRDRRNAKVGTRVVSVGVSGATSSGTAVTAGTTSEGAWTSLGTLASTDAPWWWQYAMGINNGTITAVGYACDLGIGDASNKALVDQDRYWIGTTGEIFWDNGLSLSGGYQAKGGDIVYGRMQCSGTAVTGLSMAAYGVI